MKRILQNTLTALNKHERRRLILLAFTDVIISIMDISVLALLLFLVHSYTQPGSQLRIPFLSDWFGGNKVVASLLAVMALFIAKNLAGYLAQKARYNFVYNVAARISELHLLQYLEGNYHDYVDKDSAVHIRRISQQPVEFGHYVLAGFQQLFSEAVIILLTVIAIILYDATLFLWLCIILLPPLVLLSFYIKRRLSTVRSNVKTSSEKALQHLKEALSGYIESNVFDKKEFLTNRYTHKQQTLNKYLAELQSAQALPPRLMETIAVAGLVLLVGFNELVLDQPVINIITIGAFLAAAYKIIPGLVKILNTSGQVRTYGFTAEEECKMKNGKWKSAFGEMVENETERRVALKSVEMRNIFYNYGDKQVLENFSLCAKAGEIVGLAGVSGRGKTTLLNLLLGFLEPGAGTILFNNNMTTQAQRQAAWKHINYIKQQPFLLHDSVLTNITLSSEYNEEQLQQAVKDSGLDTLLKHLPGGLNAVITENGKNISGGQRQRIAFARALYKNADLILLDEPFNELDDASEQAMLQHLLQLRQAGKIIILITHNKNSLSFCSRTISLDA